MSRLRSRPPLFRARKNQTSTNSVRRQISNSGLNGHDTSDSNFLLDSYKSGFRSTQQLALDFSQFKNHTFFSPARAKVDLALFKSINEYPYTGSQSDIDTFLTRLTGFEKYVFDSIPKNKGYLFFSGTQVGETSGGTYISVSPYSGKEFSDAPGANGALCLQLKDSPFEIEAHIFVPNQINDNQIIFQRIQNEAGITLALSSSNLTDYCKILFLVSSASDSYLVASGSIEKGNFSHIRACLFTEDDGKRALIYADDALVASSSDIQDFGELKFDSSNLNIGSGSSHFILDYLFTPSQTLSGAIDELRIFSDQRSNSTVSNYKDRQIYATSSLQLYFRFDEPSGSYDMNDVVLDYSGHCLHSRISNFSIGLRNTSSIEVPLSFQDPYYSPVLYPDYGPFTNFIENLIESASYYDEQNPNIVTNLVPRHYLDESALVAGLPNFDSGIGFIPSLENVPGTGEIERTSAILRVLIMMSISLDEIKQFADSMSNLLAIEPGDEEQVSSQMIRYAGEYFGIDLPNFFAKSTTDQFSFGQSVQDDSFSSYTLRSLRDDLWRRILASLPYVNSAKGTKSAVRSILLSSGIIPENFFVIREFGMAGEAQLSDLRDQSIEVTSMIDFSGSLINPTGSFVAPGFRSDSPRIVGSFLSGSRVEIGQPLAVGTFTNKEEYYPHGISSNPDDGLLTSGSFSVEGSFVFDKKIDHPTSQSLLRLQTTGSTSPFSFMVSNLFYSQDAEASGTLSLAVRASSENPVVSPDSLVLFLTGVNLFDGERWTVGFERNRADLINSLSSSYTLRCARHVGDQTDLFVTSAYYSEYSVFSNASIWSNINALYNASGSYIVIGSQSFGSSPRFLNSQQAYRHTGFTGKVSHIKFASAPIGNKSFVEHSKNFASIGMTNPEIGLGFDLVQTGAFERLRIDASCDQATTSSDASGNIRIFDFSQNELHFSGSGFGIQKQVIKPYLATIDRISPRFDLQQASNKVRIRGLNQTTETDPSYVINGPVYEIYNVDEIVDDVRFAIEHSVVKALNEDIISTIGDTQYLDNSMGQPSDLFSDKYYSLDHFSDVYFNRLTSKIDLARTYDVFRWVDVALSDLVESILPKRTKFMGINYIVEPHLLERAKLRYRSEEMYYLTDLDSGHSESEAFLAISSVSIPYYEISFGRTSIPGPRGGS